VHEHQGELMAAATAAVMAKIMQHDGAAQAMAVTLKQMAERQNQVSLETSETRP
jgi:hypothetical protein